MDKNFEQIVDQYARGLGEVVVDDQRLEGWIAYKLPDAELDNPDQAIFLLVKHGSLPLLIDVACDPKLATNLRTKYESVVPSKLMDERSWNRVICSGQLNQQEVLDLVNLSYQLVARQLGITLSTD